MMEAWVRCRVSRVELGKGTRRTSLQKGLTWKCSAKIAINKRRKKEKVDIDSFQRVW